MNFMKIKEKRKYNVCNNCSEPGHKYYECPNPILSCGMVVFAKIGDEIKYLMVCRKSSFGYVDLICGNYQLENVQQIQDYIDEMTNDEKQIVQEKRFSYLYNTLYTVPRVIDDFGDESELSFKNNTSPNPAEKFQIIKNGYAPQENEIPLSLKELVDKSETDWIDADWEFPKGRRQLFEKDLNCAKREFEEETGILCSRIHILDNLMPIHETYEGSDHKLYTNRYFLAQFVDDISTVNLENFQKSEISNMNWKNIDECLSVIRSTHESKKLLIQNITKIL